MQRSCTGISSHSPPARLSSLSTDEERFLAHRWHALEDEKALARLVQTHLGLVIRIAMEFRHSGPAWRTSSRSATWG